MSFALLFSIVAAGQPSYPVHVSVQVLQPYSLHLSDYYSGSRDRLIITLLNRDNQQPTLQVKLRIEIKNGSAFQLRSRDELYYPVITLQSGIPYRLSNIDLSPYLTSDKITINGYLNNGKLPTGMTEFRVQAIDYQTGRPLSAFSTGRAWMENKLPPQLNLPAKDEQIALYSLQHIRFQWMPRHQGLAGTMYEFVLKELPDNGVAPQSVFLYGNEIYRTQIRSTTLNYTHLEPQLSPAKRYGWQVRAIAMDGIDEIGVFENNGYSEVSWFTVSDNCPSPTEVNAKGGYRKMTVSWKGKPEHNGFTVEYRPKSESQNYEWTTIPNAQPDIVIPDLKAGWTYQYRVGGLCMTTKPVFSPDHEITLSINNQERLAQCGLQPKVDLSNQEPKEELNPGEVVIIGGDFPMTVTQVTSQGNGWFSGKGRVLLPWIFDVQIAVQFNRLRVNTDNRQIDGQVETLTDPNASQIANTNELDYGGKSTTAAKVVFEPIVLDFTIPDIPKAQYNPENGELTVLDTNGEPHVITPPKNEGGTIFPMIIEDAEGNQYQVDAPPTDDELSETQESSSGKQTPVITKIDKVTAPLTQDKITDPNITVTFAKGQGKYALDLGQEPWYQTALLIKSYYPVLSKDYVVATKLVPTGEHDVVEATVNGKNIDLTKIKFTLTDGKGVASQEKEGKFILNLPGVKGGETYEVLALYEKKKGKYETVGKLKVVSYPTKEFMVTLVPVNGIMPNIPTTEAALNKIYNPYGITIRLQTDNSINGNMEWDIDDDWALNLNGSGFFSKESPEMKNLRLLYQRTSKEYDKQHYYIFVLDVAKADSEPDSELVVLGDMPRSKQFGYIFTDMPRLMAHELGHGIFTLLHTFDVNYAGDGYKSKTSNLMDYSQGSELAAWQWNVMHNPAPITWFDSEEDSYAPWLTTGTQSIYRFIHLYQCALKRGGTFDFHRLGSEEPYYGEIKVNGKKIKIVLRLPKDLTDYYPQKTRVTN